MALIEFKNLPDTTTPITAENLNHNFNEIFNLIYPIGSIYMNVNNIDPSIIFGGKWVQIEDRFLLGASSTYESGSIGGSDKASAQLEIFTSNNILYMDSFRQDLEVSYTTNKRFINVVNSASEMNLSENQMMGLKVSSINDKDKIMPPYLAVYIWKRTE